MKSIFGVFVLGFQDVGGYQALIEKFRSVQPNISYVGFNSDNESCSTVPDNYMHLLRSPTDPVVPWTGTTFGLTIIAVWNWCFDQVFVQRTLSAKNLCHAKGGCILAGYLKILPLFLVVFPGMAARVLFPDEIGCSKPEVCKEICGSENGCTNVAYPLLVIHLMPHGATGLMLATMMAALVTSLTSVFNSSSTLFAIDIWIRIRKQASEMEVLIVGRVFVLFMTVVSILWIPIVQSSHSSQLYQYTQSVTSYLAPPVSAIFILAMFWERINEPGAFWGLMCGQVMGIIRFVLDFVYQEPHCSSSQRDSRPGILTEIHYLHFACIQFLFTAFCTVTFSLLTKPIDKKHLYRLTFWTRFSDKQRIDIDKEHEMQSNNGDQAIALEERNILETQKLESSEILEKRSFIKAIPLWRKALNLMCGMGLNPDNEDHQKSTWLTLEQEAQSSTGIVEESSLWKQVCDVNGLCLLVVGVFMFGFYA
ncbi:sodium/glucose cotransporter 4-like [Limulus polyphemus]|uniref:Sodium/glucose cotransporter 4-like n=1 Tax=Limulus polyphemus TaxID=6850 RepID=A0ABM1BRT0_LIMPO|nr:sodium/glucose cotransporter 4-like [Limulus polyphemus]